MIYAQRGKVIFFSNKFKYTGTMQVCCKKLLPTPFSQRLPLHGQTQSLHGPISERFDIYILLFNQL